MTFTRAVVLSYLRLWVPTSPRGRASSFWRLLGDARWGRVLLGSKRVDTSGPAAQIFQQAGRHSSLPHLRLQTSHSRRWSPHPSMSQATLEKGKRNEVTEGFMCKGERFCCLVKRSIIQWGGWGYTAEVPAPSWSFLGLWIYCVLYPAHAFSYVK